MKIVVDTNVLISGIFFGGFPRKVIESIVDSAGNVYLDDGMFVNEAIMKLL